MKNKIMFTMLAAILVIASMAMVSATAIWTTTSDCNSPQDENQYLPGQDVYIHGLGFDSNTLYSWDITGKPGGASCDPGIVVANGSQSTNSLGGVCFKAYTITDDCGEYSVKFDKKNDNYRVQFVDAVPEFSTYVGILTALGAVGTFFMVRRK